MPLQVNLLGYVFVDMADADYASDMSLVVELTYTTQRAEAELAGIFNRHASVRSSRSSVSALSQPSPRPSDAADTHPRRGRRCRRPRRSALHTSERRRGVHASRRKRTACGRILKGTIQMIRESEEAIVRHSRLLEEQVRERTAALEASNRAATLYLDIMGHDINNANNVANLYADLLQAELEGGPEAELLGKARKGLTKSIEIVHDVNTIQQVQGGVPSLRPIDLDAVIRAEIERSPAPITYAGTTASVLADDLLSEIFANLIGNAVKHGGPSVEIAVRVAERGEEVEVSVEDTGPGIPDAVKARLFERLVRGAHSTAGAG